jgi:hypothetical protein
MTRAQLCRLAQEWDQAVRERAQDTQALDAYAARIRRESLERAATRWRGAVVEIVRPADPIL